jgi:hypothetical protein
MAEPFFYFLLSTLAFYLHLISLCVQKWKFIRDLFGHGY